MGASKNTTTGIFVFGLVVLSMMGGVVLTMAGLLYPDWVSETWTEGIVVVTARIGLWRDELCDYKGCKRYWIEDDDYDSHAKATFSYRKEIRWVETVGVVLACLGLVMLVPLWCARRGAPSVRLATQFFFFVPSLCSAFLCVAGALMVSIKIDEDDVEWAPILSGVGSALVFVAAMLSCVFGRCNSVSKAANENTPKKAYVLKDTEMPPPPPATETLQYRL